MKLPRTLLILTAVFASSLLFFGIFLISAIRRRSLWQGICAAIAAVASCGTASVIADYFRRDCSGMDDFHSMDQVIDDFFDPADGEDDTVS